MTDIAYKVVAADEWRAAVAEGRYEGSAVDLADGYIHMSTEDQLAETLHKHYAGQADLLMLSVDLTRFSDDLVWEPSRGGALFPHLYAPLPVTAVTASRRLSVTTDGEIIFEDAA
ncbi:uncharacterized protein (DUF952 family) [Brevundimonas nasdae]|uniref:DUF952 domain-containing protein n=1 Tax=Brevundimonas nasdae TaxID=172043 RepID=UPI001911BE5B|nr:DUF952 domain-containing protein [Brevundimonas nasdae]MBK6023639.1 DUF952 domain-containing protein [Brevundimonas nasdae]MDQ0450291.1 uncharacterized protein (DUF952 family) [Brevundimonas nasdae]